MKKLFALIAVLFCFTGFVFADEISDLLKEPQDSMTRTIIPEDQHVVAKTASVKIDYTPLTDEVRIYYTCMSTYFEQGEAMNTVLACLEDFQKQNQYFKYTYLKRDAVKYFKDDKNLKWAQYYCYLKFSR